VQRSQPSTHPAPPGYSRCRTEHGRFKRGQPSGGDGATPASRAVEVEVEVEVEKKAAPTSKFNDFKKSIAANNTAEVQQHFLANSHHFLVHKRQHLPALIPCDLPEIKAPKAPWKIIEPARKAVGVSYRLRKAASVDGDEAAQAKADADWADAKKGLQAATQDATLISKWNPIHQAAYLNRPDVIEVIFTEVNTYFDNVENAQSAPTPDSRRQLLETRRRCLEA
jgi:hypothetical protein